jgi:ABC-type multidrug transport system fused ATPase/permease subunit
MEVALILGSMALSAILFITQDASHAAAGLALFIASGSRIGPALLRIQQSLIQVQSSYIESLPALKLINEIRLQPTRILQSNNLEANSFVPHIQIQSVYFRYSGSEKYVISDFSLEISPGMTVAIVGPSGGGKSTFIDLVLGIHKPEAGVVLISGEIPEQAIVNWPGKIAYVPQDVRVIDAAILENIALGHSPEVVDFTRIGEVIKLAQLEDFVASLPLGLNENVGEFGGRLSGGQRQRIGIARALYSNPEILVLDEATSSLDGQTEADVSEALKSLKGKMSLLIVAHRLATVREADLVVYINQGEIEAMGSFNEVRVRVPDFDNQANLMGL